MEKQKRFKDEMFEEDTLILNCHESGIVLQMENPEKNDWMISLDLDSTKELLELLKKNYEDVENDQKKENKDIADQESLEKEFDQLKWFVKNSINGQMSTMDVFSLLEKLIKLNMEVLGKNINGVEK